ncbi:MAG: hypothetical protein IAG13_02525 [Deltaproteobacteria bacterium]|nr:hypothetical protein [Nannocystaceae bacterium]
MLWQTTNGSALWESAFASAIGADGRIAIAGPVDWPFTSGFVSIYEADGTPVTNVTTPDAAYGLVWDSNLSFVVAAELPAGGVNLRRYDNNGTELWTQSGGVDAYVGALERTAAGSLVIGGGTETTGLIARFDGSGAPLSTISTPIDMYVSDLAVARDGIVAIGTDLADNPWIGKYGDDDVLQWSHAGMGIDAKAIAVAANGTVFAAVQTVQDTAQLLRYAPDGTALADVPLPWASALITDLTALDDGGVLVTASNLLPHVHCTLSRVTVTGVMTWGVAFVDVPDDNECVETHPAADGTLVATGSMRDPTGDGDMWVVSVQP